MKQISSYLRGQLLGWLLLLISSAAHAQAPAWQMALGLGPTVGSASCQVTATAAGAGSSVYLGGLFSGTVNFGGISLTSAGGLDVFVAKWDNNSQTFIWAQRIGNGSSEYLGSLVVSNANVYIAGSFQGPVNFGTTTLTAGTGAYNYNVFVAKLVDAGSTSSILWAQQAGGLGYDGATAMSVSGSNVYVAGIFTGAATFGSTALSSAGTTNGFITKMTDSGTAASFVWAQRTGGTGADDIKAIAANNASVYVTGVFTGSASFGSTALSSAGNSDGFIAKLTDAGSTGSFVWAQRFGGTAYDEPAAVVTNGIDVYVAGNFLASASFGGLVLTSAGNREIFVTKLVDAGLTSGFMWTQQAGGINDDVARSMVLKDRDLYVVGNFGGTFAAGNVGATALFGTTTLTGAGNADVFVAKLSDIGTAGSFAWARQAGGTGDDKASALALNGGNVYVGGDFYDAATFGSITARGLSTSGFLASLTDPTLTATKPALTAASTTIFPNPAHGRATVQLPAGTGTAILTVLDALGRAVRTQIAPADAPAALDLAGLPAGLYAVRVQASGHTAAHRLIIE